ncbi:LEA domain-containing protein [Colletotrichum sojae]|uniref:LEA domain-containing protein n=1 Tax=Colletotrichum sojae TaxID=2175907 RepID=A0A8H6N1T4_9PEZI|nr:LEA domain-containing protein [Colletotrichum sojae]
MTASPPTRPTPPTAQSDEPDGPASTHSAHTPMQTAVPERPKSSSHTMPRSGPRPASGTGDPDHAPRNDEYEVVEVEDEEAGVEEAPRRNVRPPLPRLNSSSRTAPSAAPVPETSSAQPPAPPPRRSSNTGTPQPQKGGPFHLQSSREIPIPTRKSSTQAQSAPRPSSSSSSPGDTAGSRTDEGSQESKPTSAGSPTPQPQPQNPQGKNAPIQIPKVTPISSGLTMPPNLTRLAEGLEGKYVDEFGNILEWNGQVLGRVEGDLPAMIGRPVSATGEIFSEDGEVVGYVAENDTLEPAPPSPKPIEGMGDGLKVDHMGNILDSNSNVIGHFDGSHLAKTGHASGQSSGSANPNPKSENCSCGRPKPSSTPSPSEIFMDVKSTNDGIQLIIKIPTVFHNGGGPNIHIGSGGCCG